MRDDVRSGHHWRSLYESVLDHEGDGLSGMLSRWLEEHPAHVAEVREAGRPESRYLMGSMLLKRAGVVVTAGTRHLVAGVADRSTLYWTFWRRSRPTDDLSHGWGHNSQWSTDFRRDYLVDGRLHYNVDRALDPYDKDRRQDGQDLSTIDLVRHRCDTVADRGDDLYPYDDHHVEQAPAT